MNNYRNRPHSTYSYILLHVLALIIGTYIRKYARKSISLDFNQPSES